MIFSFYFIHIYNLMHFWRHIHIKHLLYSFICKSIITFSNRL
nr:MAG TPA: hypothetical protein [Caudoviricetes sp.]